MKVFILTMFILYSSDAGATLARLGWGTYPIKTERDRRYDASRLVVSLGITVWVSVLIAGGAQ